MAIYYDDNHRSSNLKDCVYIKMMKTRKVDYHLSIESTSLSTKKIESFKIRRKVDDLAYELELPKYMKIHNVIFVVHLEQASPNALLRDTSSSPPIEHEGDRLYVIERIIRREVRDEELEYIIK